MDTRHGEVKLGMHLTCRVALVGDDGAPMSYGLLTDLQLDPAVDPQSRCLQIWFH